MKNTERVPVRQPDRVLSYFENQRPVLAMVTVSGLIYNLGLVVGPWFEGQLAQCLLGILNGNETFPGTLPAAGFCCANTGFPAFCKRLPVQPPAVPPPARHKTRFQSQLWSFSVPRPWAWHTAAGCGHRLGSVCAPGSPWLPGWPHGGRPPPFYQNTGRFISEPHSTCYHPDRRNIPRITGSVLLIGDLQRNVTVCPAARTQRRWRRQR